jgi:hypothetical protein
VSLRIIIPRKNETGGKFYPNSPSRKRNGWRLGGMA